MVAFFFSVVFTCASLVALYALHVATPSDFFLEPDDKRFHSHVLVVDAILLYPRQLRHARLVAGFGLGALLSMAPFVFYKQVFGYVSHNGCSLTQATPFPLFSLNPLHYMYMRQDDIYSTSTL